MYCSNVLLISDTFHIVHLIIAGVDTERNNGNDSNNNDEKGGQIYNIDPFGSITRKSSYQQAVDPP
jgi:20S proteasome alpha/beta subunit